MFELIRANQRRAVVLVVAMAALLLILGFAVGEMLGSGLGPVGLLLALVFWFVLSLTSYFSGDSILLASSRARKIEKADHPVLFNVVEEMCVAAGVSRLPKIFLIDDAAPNAFATGRDQEHASVAVTSGLLMLLTRDELQGVIAHELGHIRNRDILYMTMVGVMLGAIILLADVARRSLFWGTRTRTSSRRGGGQAQILILVVALAVIILAPIAAQLIYFAVSRRREYLADASSAQYTRYPEGLASALEKLGGSATKLRAANAATASMYIVNPLKRNLSALGSTHPPIDERVRILRSMGGMAGFRSYDNAFRNVTGRAVGVVPFGGQKEPEVAAKAPVPAPIAVPMPDAALVERPALTAAVSAAASAAVAAAPEASHVERVRQTTDLLWKLNDYIFVACPCGTNLKIPPVYAGKKIECPHCRRMHTAE